MVIDMSETQVLTVDWMQQVLAGTQAPEVRRGDGHALIGMLRAIVTTAAADYDSLIGQRFDDHF